MQSGEVQSGSMVGRLTFTISRTPSLARCLPPLSRLFLSRFTRLSRRSRRTLSLSLSLSLALVLSVPPFLVLPIYIARASAFTPRVHLLPRGTSFVQNDASHTREARTHACTHVSPSSIRHRSNDDRFTPGTRICEPFERKTHLDATKSANSLFADDVRFPAVDTGGRR